MMTEESIGFDSVLSVCQNQHLRIVLGVLTEEQRSVTLDDLMDAILKYNHEMPPIEASEDKLGEIHLSLYHVHLPKLASEGLIHYDQEQRLVEPTEQLEEAQPTVSSIVDADPSLKAPMEL